MSFRVVANKQFGQRFEEPESYGFGSETATFLGWLSEVVLESIPVIGFDFIIY